MNATTLRDRIMEPITAVWEKAENKEAHLSVAELRDLENQVREIFFDAKGEVCTHPSMERYCYSCGRVLPAEERKSA